MISILPALAGVVVLNFENGLTQKCAHHVSYDVYQHMFGHHCYHDHFVLRVDRICHFCPLKKSRIPNEHFFVKRPSYT